MATCFTDQRCLADNQLLDDNDGWTCSQCTFVNKIERPGCEICSAEKPSDNHEKVKEYDLLRQLDDQLYVTNVSQFECQVCFMLIPSDDGVVLRQCCDEICLECLRSQIHLAEGGDIPCPICNTPLEDREVRGIAFPEDYERYFRICHRLAESNTKNSFHCKTPNCQGWVVFHDRINKFKCEVCSKENCITCAAIHEGMNCRAYQSQLEAAAKADKDAEATLTYLKEMEKSGEAMKCPGCSVIILKKEGCDWIQCSVCEMEICWATKGPRWGPKGHGDISGGCKCRANGKKCHPKCTYCH